MAVRVFYGVCTTADDDAIKEVFIHDSDINTNGFQFQTGDLLSVYFLYKNTAASPTLTIYNGDAGQEVSTIVDSGKFIKNYANDIDNGGVDLWSAGETLIFCYTQLSGHPNVWEILDRRIASTDTYGITKLEGDQNDANSISTWLSNPVTTEDYNTALTPSMLKKFYSFISGVTPTEGGSEAVPAFRLEWAPNDNIDAKDDEGRTIFGTLSFGSIGINGVDVTYNLGDFIELQAQTPAGPVITNTSQLYNDGQGSNTRATGDGNFYLTNILPDNTKLYFMNGNTKTLLLDPNSTGGNTIIPRNLAVGTTTDSQTLYVHGDLVVGRSGKNGSGKVYGPLTVTGKTTSNTIEASGIIETTGNIRAKEFFESGVTLSQKYSKLLRKVNVKSTEPISFDTSGYQPNTGLIYLDIPTDDDTIKTRTWTPIGIVGFMIDNYHVGDSYPYGRGCAYTSMNVCDIVTKDGKPKVRFGITNHGKNKDLKVSVRFVVLEVLD